MNSKEKALIKMSKGSFIKEHTKLLKALKSRSPKLLKEEAREQGTELKHYQK
jgi:hypothetical protein